MMVKYTISGEVFFLNSESLGKDYDVLLTYNNIKIKTIDVKNAFDSIIKKVEYAISVGGLFNKTAEELKRALTVYKFIKYTLCKEERQIPRKEDVKLAIDVLEELTLQNIRDESQRIIIKVISMFVKNSIDDKPNNNRL